MYRESAPLLTTGAKITSIIIRILDIQVARTNCLWA